MVAIRNIRKQNYLWEHGVKPDYERNGVYYYKTCRKLLSLLESYDI